MSRLTFAVAADGLAVPVLLGLSQPDLASLVTAGQPVPAPVLLRGLIDTGCDLTGVATTQLRRLGLKPFQQTKTQAAGGPMSVDIYEVSLSITDPAVAGAAMLVQPQLVVTELPHPPQYIDVLIGLDVILECRLLIDGPTRTFTLDF